MKNLLIIFLLGATICMQTQSFAMTLNGEILSSSKLYKPTKSAVKKTLDKMGITYSIDSDGDINYELKDNNWTIYIIFNETSSGKLWNIQMVTQFGTKKSRYDELIEYVNSWNKRKKYPKTLMYDRDSLRLYLDYPIQYGFNPDEFEDNVLSMFERTVKTIANETEEMRR